MYTEHIRQVLSFRAWALSKVVIFNEYLQRLDLCVAFVSEMPKKRRILSHFPFDSDTLSK